MAIVNSLAIGKSKKSAGNLTYATVKGRTIAKQKPVSVANPNTPAQIAQRTAMATIVMFWQLWASAFKGFFTKRNKLFSEFNQFVHLNKKIMHTPDLITTTGLIGNIEGMYITSGKYNENTLSVSTGANPKVSTNNMDLLLNIAEDDFFILVKKNDDSKGFLQIPIKLTADDIADLVAGNGISLTDLSVGDVYAVFYLSADNKVNSTAVFATHA